MSGSDIGHRGSKCGDSPLARTITRERFKGDQSSMTWPTETLKWRIVPTAENPWLEVLPRFRHLLAAEPARIASGCCRPCQRRLGRLRHMPVKCSRQKCVPRPVGGAACVAEPSQKASRHRRLQRVATASGRHAGSAGTACTALGRDPRCRWHQFELRRRASRFAIAGAWCQNRSDALRERD